MSPEQQQIVIAEACGWQKCPCGESTCRWKDGSHGSHALPDYLNDLNAMHEAEKVLLQKGYWIAYTNQLWKTAWPGEEFHVSAGSESEIGRLEAPYWHLLHATAAQRAEAFLRTIGALTDSK